MLKHNLKATSQSCELTSSKLSWEYEKNGRSFCLLHRIFWVFCHWIPIVLVSAVPLHPWQPGLSECEPAKTWRSWHDRPGPQYRLWTKMAMWPKCLATVGDVFFLVHCMDFQALLWSKKPVRNTSFSFPNWRGPLLCSRWFYSKGSAEKLRSSLKQIRRRSPRDL